MSFGEEPRKNTRFVLSEEQLEAIAERAAELALETFYSDFYAQVGKVTVRSVLYICGAAFTALAIWLGATGKLG
jgi:hypothetical protein